MPWYALDVGIGDRHHDDEARGARVRREELVAVDHPLVAVLDRAGGEHLRVGARVRLGHRVAREALAVEQRLQVLLLLRLGAVVGDDLGVAGVGCGGAEHDRRPARRAEDLVDQRELQLAEALAAELGPEVRTPETLGRAPPPASAAPAGRSRRRAGGTSGAGRSGRAARPSRARTGGSTPASSRTRVRSRSPTPSRRLPQSSSTTGPRTAGPASPRSQSRLRARPRWRTPRRSRSGGGQPPSPPLVAPLRTSFFTTRTASGPFAAIFSASATASSTSRARGHDPVDQAELERAGAVEGLAGERDLERDRQWASAWRATCRRLRA